jgi:ribosomal protein S18 acetylase RimI-like enzyme
MSSVPSPETENPLAVMHIVDYDAVYQPDFFSLNEAWIAPNFGMEQEDIDFLSNPQREILDKGGRIWIALYDDQVVGCCGLFKMDDKTFEMIRVAVDSRFQGLGIGKRLILHAVDWAKAQPDCMQVILESSSQPVNAKAVAMYERLGFSHYLPKAEHRSTLARADVFMVMDISSATPEKADETKI